MTKKPVAKKSVRQPTWVIQVGSDSADGGDDLWLKDADSCFVDSPIEAAKFFTKAEACAYLVKCLEYGLLDSPIWSVNVYEESQENLSFAMPSPGDVFVGDNVVLTVEAIDDDTIEGREVNTAINRCIDVSYTRSEFRERTATMKQIHKVVKS